MKNRKVYLKLLGIISLSIGLVIILFLLSEKQVHRNNAFTRRFPPHPVIKEYDLDLGYNSYYIAGFENNLLYLGNSTAPWHLLQVNLRTRDTTHIRLEPQNKELQFRSLKVEVLPPYFFVMEGTMPFILRGKIGVWKANSWMEGKAYFNRALPIDSTKIFIRSTSSITHRSTLGTIENTNGFEVRLDTMLLQQQLDGVFDVDGIMVRNEITSEMGYVYYYRNQFITMDSEMQQISRQRTIDTVRYAQIQVAAANSKGQVQMKAPPLTVNKTAYMSDNLMLIQSDRLGRNEIKEMGDQASIIDVYNYRKGTYEFSFYLYDIDNHKAREFNLHENRVVALIANKVSVYQTVDPYFSKEMTYNIKETIGQ